MTALETLRDELKKLAEKVNFVPEGDHVEADKLLLEYINDPEVTRLFNEIEKWYA